MNISKDKKVLTIVVVAIVTFIITMPGNLNSNSWNADALDLDNFQGVDNIGQSVKCVIVVAGCDGQGSVSSSGDTIIGSDNGNNDSRTANNTNNSKDENGTLIVIKEVECGLNVDPNSELCQAILAQISPDDSTMQIRDAFDNEIFDSFDASSTGTQVELVPGQYNVAELIKGSGIIAKNNIDQQFGVDIEDLRQFSGDCFKLFVNVGTVNVESGQTFECVVTDSWGDYSTSS